MFCLLKEGHIYLVSIKNKPFLDSVHPGFCLNNSSKYVFYLYDSLTNIDDTFLFYSAKFVFCAMNKLILDNNDKEEDKGKKQRYLKLGTHAFVGVYIDMSIYIAKSLFTFLECV
jgi:hypothetical protein